MFDQSTTKAAGLAPSDLKVAVEYREPGDLKPDPKNARHHPESQIKILAKSIGEFGFVIPILVDGHSQILAGHARWSAANLLKLEQVPTIRIDHLTPAQRLAFTIADNRLTELAIWDEHLLAENLKSLTDVELGFDIEVTGFCIPEIDILIEGATVQAHEIGHADDVPAPNSEPVSQLGDLWCLGPHRVLCADALRQSSYAKLMGSALADIVFTDVPYNVSIANHASTRGKAAYREFPMASGEMTSQEFTSFLTGGMKLLAQHSRPGSLHYHCIDWRHVGEMLAAGKDIYSELKNICVWVKPNGGMGAMYRSQHELVFVFKNGTESHRNNIQLGRFGRNRSNVWNYSAPSAFGKPTDAADTHGIHPTTKPVALVADAIMDASRRGDIVLDGFLGSGSTLIAAERTGRRCFGLELDPLYVDAIVRRWESFSGGTAVHKSGETFAEIAEQRKPRDAE